MLKHAVVVVGCSLVAAGCASGGLPAFGSNLGMQSAMGQEVRPPYTSVVSYYGYVEPGAEPDEVRENKKMFYLYTWVPVVAPEIGVRMISPVKGAARPDKKDFVAPAFETNAESAEFFDTWVRVERCLTAVNEEDITKPCSQWVSYGESDDSSELPAQPSGSKYNSVLRLTSDAGDPMKALVRGMYRIVFTTYKPGDVRGTFLAQVGAPVELPGTAIARTPAELASQISAQQQAQ